jgi:hypothetical protein
MQELKRLHGVMKAAKAKRDTFTLNIVRSDIARVLHQIMMLKKR